jgi:SAM-dependent methyltransferase
MRPVSWEPCQPDSKDVTRPINLSEGRTLFGLNPDAYDAVRPDYPPWIYERLQDSGALVEGSATLEIGAGSGLATRGLLEHGADPLVVIEPDARFAPRLESILERSAADSRLIQESFEDATLERGAFDLVAAATAFHWVKQGTGLAKIFDLLRPGRYVALWWNVFQVLGRHDAFHEATHSLLAQLANSPSAQSQEIPFALNRGERETAVGDAGFQDIQYTESRWTLTLDTAQVGALYEGFSSIQRLPEPQRRRLLDALMRISDARFDGRVERHMTTCLYLARTP